MNSFVDRSQPREPYDAPDTPRAALHNLSGDSLRLAVRELKLSNSVVGRGVGRSDTQISQWLNNKYPGNNAGLETRLREWLRDRRIADSTGVSTIETDITRTMFRKLQEIRDGNKLAVMVGPAGVGKSRGIGLFLQRYVLATGFRSLPWRSGIVALAEDLCKADEIDRIPKGQRRWDFIIEKNKGSGRLLLIDDAQELGPRAFQAGVDYHEETGNPVCFTGLPILEKKFLADSRRARRVGAFYKLGMKDGKIAIKDPLPLVSHLVSELAPDANGDSQALISLCLQVAAHDGAFGAVEQQLIYARDSRKKDKDLLWPAAFRAAHKRLLRNYTLN